MECPPRETFHQGTPTGMSYFYNGLTSSVSQVYDSVAGVLTHDPKATQTRLMTRHLLTYRHVQVGQVAFGILQNQEENE